MHDGMEGFAASGRSGVPVAPGTGYIKVVAEATTRARSGWPGSP